MKKWVLAAAAAIAFAGPASAAVVTLQSTTNNGTNNNTYTYQGTLGPDEGLRTGDRFVVYDFSGYIAGSIFTTAANFTTGTENTTAAAISVPGQVDDPNLVNLVFTYTGPDIRTAGGPFAALDFNSFGARSTFSNTRFDTFYTQTTKNNPPGEAGTAAYQVGMVRVPNGVPEPATWAMMLGGFGFMGAAMRRRTRVASVAA